MNTNPFDGLLGSVVGDIDYEMFDDEAIKEYAKILNKSIEPKAKQAEGYVSEHPYYNDMRDVMTMRNRANMRGYTPISAFGAEKGVDPKYQAFLEDQERLKARGLEGEAVKEYQKNLEDMQADQALTILRAKNLAEAKAKREAEAKAAEEARKVRHARLARFFEDPMYQVAALDYVFKGDASGFNNILNRIANEEAQKAAKQASKDAKDEAKADEAKRRAKAEADEAKKRKQETETAKTEYEQARKSYNRLRSANPTSTETSEAYDNLELKRLIYKQKLENEGMDVSEIGKLLGAEGDKTQTPPGGSGERAVDSIESDINRTEVEFKNDPVRRKAETVALYEELIRTMRAKGLNVTDAENRMKDFIAKVDKEIAAKNTDKDFEVKLNSFVKTFGGDETARNKAWDAIDTKYRKYLTKGAVNGQYAIKRKKK